jgi:hypothetical protein
VNGLALSGGGTVSWASVTALAGGTSRATCGLVAAGASLGRGSAADAGGLAAATDGLTCRSVAAGGRATGGGTVTDGSSGAGSGSRDGRRTVGYSRPARRRLLAVFRRAVAHRSKA